MSAPVFVQSSQKNRSTKTWLSRHGTKNRSTQPLGFTTCATLYFVITSAFGQTSTPQRLRRRNRLEQRSRHSTFFVRYSPTTNRSISTWTAGSEYNSHPHRTRSEIINVSLGYPQRLCRRLSRNRPLNPPAMESQKCPCITSNDFIAMS